jgi:hypothetical protein
MIKKDNFIRTNLNDTEITSTTDTSYTKLNGFDDTCTYRITNTHVHDDINIIKKSGQELRREKRKLKINKRKW